MSDLETPSWLNKEFILQVLQGIEVNKLDIAILKLNCEPAVAPGSNYLGDIFRVSIDYKIVNDSHSISLITKTPLESGAMKDVGDMLNAYDKEFRMYREVLPRMEELHSWRGAARSFRCPLENCLVLEDLREHGYKMANRLKQLDAAHCRQFFLSLSWLHALSVAVYHSHPDLILSVGKSAFFTGEDLKMAEEKKQIKFFLNSMVYTIKRLKGCERYVEMLSNRVDSLYDKMVEVYRPFDGLNVLNHGDTWTNNIMFKYNDSGEIVDAKMIDFQLAKFCSFAHDILYFWFTSASEEVRKHHREEMFEFYRKSLNSALEELKCEERLSKEEFDCQMKACAPFSVHVLCNFLPFIVADPDELVDFSHMSIEDFSQQIDNDSEQLSIFRSKYYKAVMPEALQQAEELGAFLW